MISANLQTFTLLIVEDCPEDRELYRRSLSGDSVCDYCLLEAESVAAGLELCRTQPIDVILLDYLLPDGNGLEFLKAVTAQSNGKTPPVVMITGQADRATAVQAMKLGAQDYLVKNEIAPELLKLTVRNAIEKSSLQRQLTAAKQQTIEIWESMTDAYVTLDRDWRIGYANQAATQFMWQLANRTPAAFLGRSLWDLFPSLVGGDAERDYRQALTDGVTLHREVWFEPTGNWLEVHLYPAAEGLGIYFRDITERKQTETRLREIERKATEQQISEQAMLIDIATDAIFVCDLANRIRFWSKGAERLYGWSAVEAIDQNAQELLQRDSLVAATVAFETAIQRGEWQGELHKVTKTGQTAIVQSLWTLVRDEVNQPKEILHVDTNITEKKQLEQQFLRVQRLESLGTLAIGVAHDMNNILTPILAASQLLPLRLTNIDDRSRSLLRILEESAKRGTNLVQQILSFARGSDGTRSPVQIRQILSEVVRVARQTFPRSIEISLNLATIELWSILADATQLHQVLMNLMVNARDAMPNGGTLTVATENLVLDENYARMNIDARIGPYVVVTISDTGTGIPPEILARIFEPFFTTKTPEQGTGLGLSTTLGIVKSHGGFVTVYSEIAQGTQFKIYFPAEVSSESFKDREAKLLG